MRRLRDFLEFVGLIIRDGFVIAATALNLLLFGLDSVRLLRNFSFSPTPTVYLLVWIVGFVVAAYRRDATLRSRLPCEDLHMDEQGFNRLVKPGLEAEGGQLATTTLARLPESLADGWEEVCTKDHRGNRRRVVIGDGERIFGVPIHRPR